MSERTEPKPTRPGEAPDDPGRAAPDAAPAASPRTDQEPGGPADALPSRRDRSGIDHPRDTSDPGPDLTGTPQG
ncbi:hypothetical protein [Roseicella aquatilis]|uniref:Uncharacterized protein n=1 Tax=Roseicella aquatilis TaxID=2527868 RepID=A0A4R4D2H7_9PROT|nr:hypothetical protein [Roseicella aquatilis]TCZ52925.1 hypothetical protein EXY23_25825 [Roseicella aquatilis]